MDFKKIIAEKREELKQLQKVDALDGVLRHLEAAEKHFKNARCQGDPEFFTDVVYRTNQVFEGILKEAYQVISKNDASKKTAAQIEEYFSKNTHFRPKVLEYFSRYRTEWRNPSTHNHRLDFDEQEAFLAYTTVCGFCFAAVNQMIQVLAAEKASLKNERGGDRIQAKTVADLLAAELPHLLKDLEASTSKLMDTIRISETALIGGIDGLIKLAFNGASTTLDPLLTLGESRLRADLLVSEPDRIVVIEVKRFPGRGSLHIVEQLKKYAEAANAIGGVGVVVPTVYRNDVVFEVKEVDAAGTPIFLVLPLGNRVLGV
jgi:hypothetical protein